MRSHESGEGVRSGFTPLGLTSEESDDTDYDYFEDYDTSMDYGYLSDISEWTVYFHSLGD